MFVMIKEIMSLISKAEDSAIKKSAYELQKVSHFLKSKNLVGSCDPIVSIFKAHSIIFNFTWPLILVKFSLNRLGFFPCTVDEFIIEKKMPIA